jgi:hypothetical protein
MIHSESFSHEDLKALAKTVYVWGGGVIRDEVVAAFKLVGKEVQPFFMNYDDLTGSSYPKIADREAFYVCASRTHLRRQRQILLSNGLTEGTDFITYLRVFRPVLSIEGSGKLLPLDSVMEAIPVSDDGVGSHAYSWLMGDLMDKRDLPVRLEFGVKRDGFNVFESFLDSHVSERDLDLVCTVNIGHKRLPFRRQLPKNLKIHTFVHIPPNSLDAELGATMDAWRRYAVSEENLGVRFLTYGNHDILDVSRHSDVEESVLHPPTYLPTLTNYESRLEGGGSRDVIYDDEIHIKLLSVDRSKPCLCGRVAPTMRGPQLFYQCHNYPDVQFIADGPRSFSDLLAQRNGSAFCTRCRATGLHRLELTKI